ncbi:MAG: hypothetical protein HYV96_12050 [Opitutae bacterium]|nr:hypothetical protein [Opitutae bacterium]
MKTKFLPQLLARVALCAALAAAAWAGLESLEFAARSENGAAASADIAMTSLAKVPVAAPWVLQLTALLRGR